MAQLHQEPLDQLPLARQPIVGLTNFLRGLSLSQARALTEADSIITEIRLQRVAQLGGAFDGLAMNVEQVAPLLGLEVRHPNDSGSAGQVGFADSYGADLIIVGVASLSLPKWPLSRTRA